MGDWNFYNIGATTLKALKNAKIIPNRDYMMNTKGRSLMLLLPRSL